MSRPDPPPASRVLPDFGFVSVLPRPLADGTAREAEWMERVADTGRGLATLWRGTPGFVVPARYTRLPHWPSACAESAAHGWPVQVRQSGGGLVPQGPGVINLSLAWPSATATPTDADAVYRDLVGELQAAFGRLGVQARAQAVEGSFCDGRYNLAVGGRKCVGTAQAWRRVQGRPVVLAHAVIVATADPGPLTEAANRFETAAGGTARYRTDALVSLAQAWCAAQARPREPDDFEARLVTALAERFARLVPPRSATPTLTTQET